MPCLWPRKGWRSSLGVVRFAKPNDEGKWDDGEHCAKWDLFTAPCGGCVECLVRKARDWAIRCTLELKQHDHAAWVTLTYDDRHLVRPHVEWAPTLYKPHVTSYLKRLRERVRRRYAVRFFAVGEYGDLTQRPHYHAILYGVPPSERHIEKAWPFGHVRAEGVTPANIAYTAGYANKKIGQFARKREWVDPDTGEVFEWQEAFRHTSRRPGIAGDARRFARSWRTTAVHFGKQVPVPRYLHQAWEEQASEDDLAQLEAERAKMLATLGAVDLVEYQRRREARDAIAHATLAKKAEQRRKL